MPHTPPKPCAFPNCQELVRTAKYCRHHAGHEKAIKRDYERRRVKNPFYLSTSWRKLSAMYRRHRPLCEICGKKPSQLVHHLNPIDAGGEPRAWDNLQALCLGCHNKLPGHGFKPSKTDDNTVVFGHNRGKDTKLSDTLKA